MNTASNSPYNFALLYNAAKNAHQYQKLKHTERETLDVIASTFLFKQFAGNEVIISLLLDLSWTTSGLSVMKIAKKENRLSFRCCVLKPKTQILSWYEEQISRERRQRIQVIILYFLFILCNWMANGTSSVLILWNWTGAPNSVSYSFFMK